MFSSKYFLVFRILYNTISSICQLCHDIIKAVRFNEDDIAASPKICKLCMLVHKYYLFKQKYKKWIKWLSFPSWILIFLLLIVSFQFALITWVLMFFWPTCFFLHNKKFLLPFLWNYVPLPAMCFLKNVIVGLQISK